MKKLLSSILFFCLLALTVPTSAQESLPSQEAILQTTLKVNRYFMDQYADPTLPTNVNRVRPSNIWTRAVYYEGLMALYAIYPMQEFYDYTYRWADFHQWGERGGCITRNADNQCCGQTYIDMYHIGKDPRMIRDIKVTMDMLVNRINKLSMHLFDLKIKMGTGGIVDFGTRATLRNELEDNGHPRLYSQHIKERSIPLCLFIIL